MRPARAAGAVLTTAGLTGYGVGLYTAYTGRAFSVTAVLIGVTLLGVEGLGRVTT